VLTLGRRISRFDEFHAFAFTHASFAGADAKRCFVDLLRESLAVAANGGRAASAAEAVWSTASTLQRSVAGLGSGALATSIATFQLAVSGVAEVAGQLWVSLAAGCERPGGVSVAQLAALLMALSPNVRPAARRLSVCQSVSQSVCLPARRFVSSACPVGLPFWW
jgi:hypothetical protein